MIFHKKNFLFFYQKGPKFSIFSLFLNCNFLSIFSLKQTFTKNFFGVVGQLEMRATTFILGVWGHVVEEHDHYLQHPYLFMDLVPDQISNPQKYFFGSEAGGPYECWA
jgi:hypothetical protein